MDGTQDVIVPRAGSGAPPGQYLDGGDAERGEVLQ